MEETLSNVQIQNLKFHLEDLREKLDRGRKEKIDQMKVIQEELKDSGDIASFEIDSEKMWLLLNREDTLKIKIDLALKRMFHGTYGLCLECDAPINFKRLKIDPTAELCIDCKNEMEEHRGAIH
jgi:DnaK suppressor protein